MPIPIHLDSLIHKGRSVGCTFWQPQSVTIDQLKLDSCTLFLDRNHFGGHVDFPELILQISFIEEFEPAVREIEETLDILVFGKGLPDVVHLKARLLSAHVWNKQNSRYGKLSRRNINALTVWSEPNSVKLGFDKNLRTLPNCPSNNGASPMFYDVRINEREAHIILGAVKRRALDIERGNVISDYLPGK